MRAEKVPVGPPSAATPLPRFPYIEKDYLRVTQEADPAVARRWASRPQNRFPN